MKITVGITDDHQLFVKSLSLLISDFENFEVIVDAMNGKQLLAKLENPALRPDILLVDVNMPVMDGAETASMVAAKYPEIKMIALSMKEDDITVIKMIRSGCCAYLLKDLHPNNLQNALNKVYTDGYYNADASNVDFRRLMRKALKAEEFMLTEKEKQFVKLACSDLTYKQIASIMHLAERTIDGYRESLFEKLNVQSRVGMVLEALRREIIALDECEV